VRSFASDVRMKTRSRGSSQFLREKERKTEHRLPQYVSDTIIWMYTTLFVFLNCTKKKREERRYADECRYINLHLSFRVAIVDNVSRCRRSACAKEIRLGHHCAPTATSKTPLSSRDYHPRSKSGERAMRAARLRALVHRCCVVACL